MNIETVQTLKSNSIGCVFSPYSSFYFIFHKDQETQALKEHLIDELDYVLVPTEAWNKLVSWYGCLEDQRPIARKVMLQQMPSFQPFNYG